MYINIAYKQDRMCLNYSHNDCCGFGLVWTGLVWFGLVWTVLSWIGLVWFGRYEVMVGPFQSISAKLKYIN